MEKITCNLLEEYSVLSSPSKFGPIAILPFLSEVMEKLACDQIMEFLQRNRILGPLQIGFRPDCSTQTALLKLTEEIRTDVDKK